MTRDHIEGFLTGISAGILLAYFVKSTGDADALRATDAGAESGEGTEPVTEAAPPDETLRWSAKA